MKRLFVCVLSALIILPIFAQNTLTIHQKDGQKFSYGFEEKPVVSFNGDTLIIRSTNTVIHYGISSLSKFTYDDNETSVGLVKSDTNKASISLDEYTINIAGAKADIKVMLIGADGKQLASYKTDKEGTVTFSISELPNGAYIISSESLTVKILKK